MRSHDVWPYIFECKEKQGKIREEKQCFQDNIPIGQDPTMFVTPNDRVMTHLNPVTSTFS